MPDQYLFLLLDATHPEHPLGHEALRLPSLPVQVWPIGSQSQTRQGEFLDDEGQVNKKSLNSPRISKVSCFAPKICDGFLTTKQTVSPFIRISLNLQVNFYHDFTPALTYCVIIVYKFRFLSKLNLPSQLDISSTRAGRGLK